MKQRWNGKVEMTVEEYRDIVIVMGLAQMHHEATLAIARGLQAAHDFLVVAPCECGYEGQKCTRCRCLDIMTTVVGEHAV